MVNTCLLVLKFFYKVCVQFFFFGWDFVEKLEKNNIH